jgi:hypothetical protein
MGMNEYGYDVIYDGYGYGYEKGGGGSGKRRLRSCWMIVWIPLACICMRFWARDCFCFGWMCIREASEKGVS